MWYIIGYLWFFIVGCSIASCIVNGGFDRRQFAHITVAILLLVVLYIYMDNWFFLPPPEPETEPSYALTTHQNMNQLTP